METSRRLRAVAAKKPWLAKALPSFQEPQEPRVLLEISAASILVSELKKCGTQDAV